MALGYFFAQVASRFTGGKFNLYLLWFVSVSPDIDLLIPFLYHRGPTHSLVVIIFFLVPVLLLRREWLPYAAGLGSHALVGDLITGSNRGAGSLFFWPFSSSFVNIGVYLRMGSLIEVGIELVLFVLMILILHSQDDFLWKKRE